MHWSPWRTAVEDSTAAAVSQGRSGAHRWSNCSRPSTIHHIARASSATGSLVADRSWSGRSAPDTGPATTSSSSGPLAIRSDRPAARPLAGRPGPSGPSFVSSSAVDPERSAPRCLQGPTSRVGLAPHRRRQASRPRQRAATGRRRAEGSTTAWGNRCPRRRPASAGSTCLAGANTEPSRSRSTYPEANAAHLAVGRGRASSSSLTAVDDGRSTARCIGIAPGPGCGRRCRRTSGPAGRLVRRSTAGTPRPHPRPGAAPGRCRCERCRTTASSPLAVSPPRSAGSMTTTAALVRYTQRATALSTVRSSDGVPPIASATSG